MEPTMINFKVLSAAAVLALVLPLAAPTASYAQGLKGGAGGHVGGGHVGGGHVGGGHMGGGMHMGGARTGAVIGNGTAVAGGGRAFRGGQARVGGGGFSGGGYRGGYHHHGGGGFFPGAVAGAIVGGALASGAYGYYAPGPGYYYDDGYADDDAVAVAPAPVGGDATAYCMQTYQSYDPESGTYLGDDGQRHPCP